MMGGGLGPHQVGLGVMQVGPAVDPAGAGRGRL